MCWDVMISEEITTAIVGRASHKVRWWKYPVVYIGFAYDTLPFRRMHEVYFTCIVVISYARSTIPSDLPNKPLRSNIDIQCRRGVVSSDPRR